MQPLRRQQFQRYAYGFGRNTPQMGTWPLSIPNNALSWEETAQGNLGIDGAF
jgi:hypothetical protein